LSFHVSGSNGTAYIALGIGSLFNHETEANLEIWLDEPALCIQFIASDTIPFGEELTIAYHHLEGGFEFKQNDKPCVPSEPAP